MDWASQSVTDKEQKPILDTRSLVEYPLPPRVYGGQDNKLIKKYYQTTKQHYINR